MSSPCFLQFGWSQDKVVARIREWPQNLRGFLSLPKPPRREDVDHVRTWWCRCQRASSGPRRRITWMIDTCCFSMLHHRALAAAEGSEPCRKTLASCKTRGCQWLHISTYNIYIYDIMCVFIVRSFLHGVRSFVLHTHTHHHTPYWEKGKEREKALPLSQHPAEPVVRNSCIRRHVSRELAESPDAEVRGDPSAPIQFFLKLIAGQRYRKRFCLADFQSVTNSSGHACLTSWPADIDYEIMYGPAELKALGDLIWWSVTVGAGDSKAHSQEALERFSLQIQILPLGLLSVFLQKELTGEDWCRFEA